MHLDCLYSTLLIVLQCGYWKTINKVLTENELFIYIVFEIGKFSKIFVYTTNGVVYSPRSLFKIINYKNCMVDNILWKLSFSGKPFCEISSFLMVPILTFMDILLNNIVVFGQRKIHEYVLKKIVHISLRILLVKLWNCMRYRQIITVSLAWINNITDTIVINKNIF